MRRLLILAASLLALAPSPASPYGAGREGSFNMGLSARSVGLGGSLAALTDDASTAMTGNPAALARLSRGQLSLFYAPLPGDTRYDAFSAALPSMDHGTLGLSAAMVSVSGIDRRDADNFSLGDIDYLEQQAALAYAYRLTDDWAVGVEGVWSRQKLGDAEDNGYRANFGLHGLRPLTKTTDLLLGLAMRDWVQTGLQLGVENDKLSPSVALGVGLDHRMKGLGLLLLLEPTWIQDNDLRFKTGLEFRWNDRVFLRGGWDGDHPAVGAGLSARNLALDYALALQSSYGSTHRVSLSYRFGRDVMAALKDRGSREDRMKAEILAKLKKDSIKTYLSAGDRFLKKKQFEEARQEYSKILAWDPKEPTALSRLDKAQSSEIEYRLSEGRRLAGRGDTLEAMVKFQSVLEMDPANRAAKKGMKDADAVIRIQSRQAFAKAVSLPPDEAQRYFEDGLNLYLAGKYSLALEKWKVIIAANPVNRQIFEYVSRAQVKLEADKARVERRRDVDVRKSRVQILQKQAFQSYQKGDLQGAVDAWKELLKADPQNAEARAQLEKAEKELLDSRKRGVRW